MKNNTKKSKPKNTEFVVIGGNDESRKYMNDIGKLLSSLVDKTVSEYKNNKI